MAKKKPEIPLSEDVRKRTNVTEEECVLELRRMAEAEPERVITRNYFRVNSSIAESGWSKYFGTFEEFKRQAGVILTRHAHRLEKDIAKHASADSLRQMNHARQGWDGKYLKPNDRRFKTVLIGSDMHGKFCDPFYRRLFVETNRRVKPDAVVFGGDIFDLAEFSRFTQDPRTFDPLGDIKWSHNLFGEIREDNPDAELWFTEGNHEFRLLRHLSEATPALKTVLADLHGFTIPKLLGIEEFEVNYVARCDLSAWTERDIKNELRKNWVTLYDSFLVHHYPDGRHMGMPGCNGHHHRHMVWSAYSPTYGPFEWHQLGSGHVRQATYCDGEKWGNGFLLAHIDTQRPSTQFEYIQILDHCVIGGQWYEREADEFVTLL